MTRQPISKRLRYEVLRRDGFTCRYCGAKAPDVEITVDHVNPVVLGGSSTAENLVAACRDCNAGKTSTTPDTPIVGDVESDALRWALAMKTAANVQYEQRARIAAYILEFDLTWTSWHYEHDGSDHEIQRPGDWENSVRTWFAVGMPIAVLTELVDQTMPRRTRDPWKYFCGAVWRYLDQQQDIAAQILAAESDDPRE